MKKVMKLQVNGECRVALVETLLALIFDAITLQLRKNLYTFWREATSTDYFVCTNVRYKNKAYNFLISLVKTTE